MHPAITDANEDAVADPVFSFDKTKAAFRVINLSVTASSRTYCTNVDGSNQVQVNQGGDVSAFPFAFSQDGTMLLLRGRDALGSTFGTHVVSTAGGNLVRTAEPLYTNGPSTINGTTGNTGRYAFLLAYYSTSGSNEVIRYDLETDTIVAAIDENTSALTDDKPFALSANGDVIVFAGERATDSQDGIFSYSFSQGMLNLVNGPLVSGGNIDISGLNGGERLALVSSPGWSRARVWWDRALTPGSAAVC